MSNESVYILGGSNFFIQVALQPMPAFFFENFPFQPCHLHDCPEHCQGHEIRVSCSSSAYPHTWTEVFLFHHCHLEGQVSYALFWIDDKRSVHNRLCKVLGKGVHMLDNTLLSWRQLVMAAIVYPIVMAATVMAFLYAQGKKSLLSWLPLCSLELATLWWLAIFPCQVFFLILNSPVIFLI